MVEHLTLLFILNSGVMRTGWSGSAHLARPERAAARWAARSKTPALLALISLAAISCGPSGSPPRQQRSVGVDGVAFVSNEKCAECHAQEFQEWQGSHHERAMQPASEETVLGDFSGAELVHFGVRSRFFRRGEAFVVETESPEGQPAEYEVLYTFGVEPLQQYLIEFPGGRLQCLTIAWDTEERRWFHLYPDEGIPPEDSLHWTGLYQNWNQMCAECHSTNLRKNYDAATHTYQTEWDEINVSCQACHGPGASHVEWARKREASGDSSGNSQPASPEDDYDLAVTFLGREPQRELNACFRCHSRRHPVSANDQHGAVPGDDFLPTTLREGLYHADGQILDEVYVYGSFVQSKMHREGVRCTDCHNPHSAELVEQGNALCTRCHQTSPPEDFPSLASKNYGSADHHHHAPTSDGAICVNCHMPAKKYMVVDPRRDHSFRAPRPDLSVKLGTPNACTACHDDQPAQWAADAFTKWYGDRLYLDGRGESPHFAEALSAGRKRAPNAEGKLIQLAIDREQPAIARATALEMLRGYGPTAVDALASQIGDSDPLVRVRAAAALDRLEPKPRLGATMPLLDDPSRAVRIEAVRVLSSVPEQEFDSEQRRAFDQGLQEFRAVQEAMLDTPSAHLNLAVLSSNLGEPEQSEGHYRQALDLDPYFTPAALNLSTMLAGQERMEEAEEVLREALERSSDEGELHYSLGLLLAEKEQLADAATSLGRASNLLSGRARVHYNYGLALQRLGRAKEAETALHKAEKVNPRDPEIVYALAVFYLQLQQPALALPYATRLVKMVPGQPGPMQMLQQVHAQLGRPG